MLSEDYKVELLKKLPVYHRGIYEFQQIAKAQEPELEALLMAVDAVLDNLFIDTASEYGINRLEKMAGIIPDGKDTLDTRKFRIQAKWNDTMPYTERALRGLLSSLCGEDGYYLKIDDANFTVTAKLAVDNESKVEEVIELLDRTVPANMEVYVTLYNTNGIIASYTHEQLSSYSHENLRKGIL